MNPFKNILYVVEETSDQSSELVSENSDLSGKSLAELHFRQKFGATLVGIRRGQDQITTINPAESLLGGDCLIVIGKSSTIEELKNLAPL